MSDMQLNELRMAMTEKKIVWGSGGVPVLFHCDEASFQEALSDDVVAVDLNDAPAGIPAEQQIDNRRTLPMATGVINLKGFLKSLVQIGYEGPIRAEPFSKELEAMDRGTALSATAQAMKKASHWFNQIYLFETKSRILVPINKISPL